MFLIAFMQLVTGCFNCSFRQTIGASFIIGTAGSFRCYHPLHIQLATTPSHLHEIDSQKRGRRRS